ncbi:type II toxin-antitoxin system Phd/YefM family antitoxin [Opitutales bacterium]|nr:type II toxin-antitoxin system Phd/YefM family antitoxin [Opitutales bacterium]
MPNSKRNDQRIFSLFTLHSSFRQALEHLQFRPSWSNFLIMKEVGLYEAKTKISTLVQQVQKSGQSIALTRHGKVVAQLCPPSRTSPTRGCLKGKNFQMSRDFDQPELGFEDFFAPESNPLLAVSESKGKYRSGKKK